MSDAERDDLLLNSTEDEGLSMDGLLAELLGNWGDNADAEPVEMAAASEEQPSEYTPLSALMSRLLDADVPAVEAPPGAAPSAGELAEAAAEIVEELPPIEIAMETAAPTAPEEAPAPAIQQAIEEPAAEPPPPPVPVEPEIVAALPEPQPLPLPLPGLEPELQPEPRDDGALRGLLSVMRNELAQSEPVRQRAQSRVEIHTRERFLAFELAGESYAVALTRVLETDRLPKVTRVPGLPGYVRGVCNLRGAVLPLVDLRLLLQLEEAAPARDERILVTRPSATDSPVALIVDSLLGVSLLAREELHRTPQWLEGKITPFLDGIGTHKGRLVSVLDLDRVFTAAELREAPAA